MYSGAQSLRSAEQHIQAMTRRGDVLPSPPSGKGTSLICRTTTDGSYPTTAGVVYVVTPLEIDADDAEGAAASYTADTTQNFYAVNSGSAVPPQGTRVLVHVAGGRAVFAWYG